MTIERGDEPLDCCAVCSMVLAANEFHPYAACLLYMAARMGEPDRTEHAGRVTRNNLRSVVQYGMRAKERGVSLDVAMTDMPRVLK